MGSVQPDQVNKISHTVKAEGLKPGRSGARSRKKLSLGKCISKRRGGKPSVSLPVFESGPQLLVLIEQLHAQGRLIGVGVARPSFINGSIGPVLPKLSSPYKHFGELVGSRQRHFAE
jgi:hypothetical protein